MFSGFAWHERSPRTPLKVLLRKRPMLSFEPRDPFRLNAGQRIVRAENVHPTARASRRFLDWACFRPAFVKCVGEDPYHPVVLGEVWSEELGASTVSLVRGPYEEHELFIV